MMWLEKRSDDYDLNRLIVVRRPSKCQRAQIRPTDREHAVSIGTCIVSVEDLESLTIQRGIRSVPCVHSASWRSTSTRSRDLAPGSAERFCEDQDIEDVNRGLISMATSCFSSPVDSATTKSIPIQPTGFRAKPRQSIAQSFPNPIAGKEANILCLTIFHRISVFAAIKCEMLCHRRKDTGSSTHKTAILPVGPSSQVEPRIARLVSNRLRTVFTRLSN